MLSPFKGVFRITSPRGERTLFGKKEFHGGIDMVAQEDTTVYAVADGYAEVLYEKDGFGKYIRQTLPDGKRIYYAHLKSVNIAKTGNVKCGTPLGVMGATGKVTGAHLHIELRPRGTSKESLDIAAFLGVPNSVGAYNAKENLHSYDDTVNALVECGIVTKENIISWEMMFSGRAELKREYVRTLFDRCCEKISSLERKNV